MKLLRYGAAACVILSIATQPGCFLAATPSSGRWGSSVSSVSSIGGSGEYTLVRLRRDDDTYVILAFDVAGRASVSGGGSMREGIVADSYGKRETAWSSSVDDDLRGEVVVQGTRFDLANGRLFLVRTANDLADVEQVDVPLERLVDEEPSPRFSAEAAKHPPIATFLEELAAAAKDPAAESPQP